VRASSAHATRSPKILRDLLRRLQHVTRRKGNEGKLVDDKGRRS